MVRRSPTSHRSVTGRLLRNIISRACRAHSPLDREHERSSVCTIFRIMPEKTFIGRATREIHRGTILLLSLAILSLLSFPSAASGSPSPAPATGAQVLAAVTASISRDSLPPNLTPPLVSFINPKKGYLLSGPSFFDVCDPFNNNALIVHPVPCLFGDLHSKKTIVLVGDSTVGNWAPALARGLIGTEYRLAVFGFAGCPTPDIVFTAATNSQFQECNEWHHAVSGAIRALRPVAVLAVSGPYNIGAMPPAQWAAGFGKLFAEATAGLPSVKRIILGTSPIFPVPVPACLAAHNDPQTCAIHFALGNGYYGEYLARDVANAAAAHAKLITTYQWFCSAGTCSPVILKYLAYADIDHLTLAYSEYLSRVATGAVLKFTTGR